MNSFVQRLVTGLPMIADGATGTNLQEFGSEPGAVPEELVLDNPEVLVSLVGSFVEAGSDIILTCTFGGTAMKLKNSRYPARSKEINELAVEIARKAASRKPGVFVAGSIGPTGQLLQPYGTATPEEMQQTYSGQIESLVKGGVDLLVIETMYSMEEATIAFEMARKVTDLPIVVSFSYDRGVRTMMGVKPTHVMEFFADNGAIAVGANCGTTLENMEKIIKEYKTVRSGIPIWAKPNAGLPQLNGDGHTEYIVSPERMGIAAMKNIELGARIVGGCCGTTPEHIAAISRALMDSN